MTSPIVRAVLWSDYLCPWCYVGTDTTALLRSLDVEVTCLPYELHPDVPVGGRAVRPGGRLAATYERIAGECAERGLPFRMPERVPNTRRALATAEVVRTLWPESFDELDRDLFRAHFVRGDPLDDPAVLDELVEAAGAPSADVRSVVDARGDALVDDSMRRAHEVGVTATPAWLLADQLLVPGVQPDATVARWVTRLRGRAAPMG